jgi:hypothetical protein
MNRDAIRAADWWHRELRRVRSLRRLDADEQRVILAREEAELERAEHEADKDPWLRCRACGGVLRGGRCQRSDHSNADEAPGGGADHNATQDNVSCLTTTG